MDGYTWSVTGQTPETQFDNQGNQTTGKNVSFTIQPSGYTGAVFIPDVLYVNTDAVRERIQTEVDAVMQVHQLSG